MVTLGGSVGRSFGEVGRLFDGDVVGKPVRVSAEDPVGDLQGRLVGDTVGVHVGIWDRFSVGLAGGIVVCPVDGDVESVSHGTLVGRDVGLAG